jgi:general secretion pathway protein E/type IV pilus assembly protein PilB
VGYTGRVGIYELLTANEEVRQLAHDRVSSQEIKRAAVRGGMRSLRIDAWNKTIEGKTSVDEALRVTKGDVLEV